MISANPRLDLLRWEVERTVLKPFRLHGWAAEIVREVDRDDCIEIAAQRGRSDRGSRRILGGSLSPVLSCGCRMGSTMVEANLE